MGEVVDIRTGLEVSTETPSCFDCEYVFVGSGGMYCSYFREEFFDAGIAVDCDAFDRIDSAL